MTQDEIIEMARQAGAPSSSKSPSFVDFLERFAKLVDAKATAREREECATVCFKQMARWIDDRARFVSSECAKAIRARGQA